MVKMSKEVFNCTLENSDLRCGDRHFSIATIYTVRSFEFWLFFGTYLILTYIICMASLFILTLSSADSVTIRIMRRTGKKEQRLMAERIGSLLKQYHPVLCTLVIVNAASEETMPIIMDQLINPMVAIIITTFVVFVFGQMLPLYLFQKQHMRMSMIASKLIWLFTILLSILVFPIGKAMDIVVGHGRARLFRRNELKELISRHGPQRTRFNQLLEMQNSAPLNNEYSGALSGLEVEIIRGILGLSCKVAADAVIPVGRVFMIEFRQKIDHQLLKSVLNAGHRFVPIYSGLRKNIVTIVSSKRLLQVDPDRHIAINHFIRYMAVDPSDFINVVTVPSRQPLFDLARRFRTKTIPRLIMVTKFFKHQPSEIIGITTQQEVFKAMLRDTPDKFRKRPTT